MEKKLHLNITSTDRKGIRSEVVNAFLAEEPGTGTGDKASKYYYTVETLKNGKVIYLKRPAGLNKGFDFEVNVEEGHFGGRIKTRPRHEDIINDLEIKKSENENEYLKLRKLIDEVYKCNSIDDGEIENINLSEGYDVEIIIKVIKWLFIEQDITYWNYSGRDTLYQYIP